MENEYTDSDNDTIVEYGVSKFKNIMGITCYMNSILHILQHVPIFMEYITQAGFRDPLIRKINKKVQETDKTPEELTSNYVIFELFRLFNTSLENEDASINPLIFKNLIGKKNDIWNEYNHQDSQEFFNFLISTIEEEVGEKHQFIPKLDSNQELSEKSFQESIKNIIAISSWIKFESREYSLLKNLFNGSIQNSKTCSYCNTKNIVFEPFMTLGLSIPIKDPTDFMKTFSVYDCLNELIKEENVDEDNRVTCEFCGIKNKAKSGTLLWKTPKLLVIHIKRFLVNSFGMPTQKITNNVLYPFKDLDLSNYFDPSSPYRLDSKYDLIGVNIHQAFGYGKSINAGHYTSIVKNIMNNKWYLYNDSHPVITITTREQLQDSNAYLLFYYQH